MTLQTPEIESKTPLLISVSSIFCSEKPANRGVLTVIFAVAALLSACSSTKPPAPISGAPTTSSSSASANPNPNTTTSPRKPGGYYQDDGPGDNANINLEAIADAVPRNEPFHSGANRPYTALGNSYVPNVAADAFRQEGMASWYGRKYHGQKTAIGETYNMYAMTAAHPTLPLPSYARVTNPANGKRVVVRVNDRGPFLADRVIDLSYVAAAKLDLVRAGSSRVIVERVFAGEVSPSSPQAAPPPTALTYESGTTTNAATVSASPINSAATQVKLSTASTVSTDGNAIYLQLGAFSSAENAESFRTRMLSELTWKREALTVARTDGLFRVRMGPYTTRADAEAVAARIKAGHNVSPVIAKP
jgi:rare lipoprotein A